MPKFYTFTQNNSGGYYNINDDVAHFLIIEANDAEQAIERMHDITAGHSEWCECCGERWFGWINESDGHSMPTVYGENVLENKPNGVFSTSTIIHYLNGEKQKLWYEWGEEGEI